MLELIDQLLRWLSYLMLGLFDVYLLVWLAVGMAWCAFQIVGAARWLRRRFFRG